MSRTPSSSPRVSGSPPGSAGRRHGVGAGKDRPQPASSCARMASVTAAASSVTACLAPGIAAARARDRVGHRLAVRGEQVASRDQDERRHGDVREVGAAASRPAPHPGGRAHERARRHARRPLPAALVGQVLGREHPGQHEAGDGLGARLARHAAPGVDHRQQRGPASTNGVISVSDRTRAGRATARPAPDRTARGRRADRPPLARGARVARGRRARPAPPFRCAW